MKRFKSQHHRAGFTLLELMVVMMLMGLMATMLIMAVRGFIGTAREKATQATILKLHGLLSDRTKSFDRWIEEFDKRAGNGRLPDYVDQRRNVATSDLRRAGWSSGPVGPLFIERAKMIARKRLFAEKFPQQFADSPGLSSPGGTHVSVTESAECLFYAIVNSELYGAEGVEEDAFNADEVQDTDGDGLREFVDNWGRPLRFYRWPTRLIRPATTLAATGTAKNLPGALNPIAVSLGTVPVITLLGALPPGGAGATVSSPIAQDPNDVLGELNSVSPTIFEFDSSITPLYQNNTLMFFHTANTYHLPLIMSAGPDGVLGLYEPNNTANFGILAQPVWSELNNLTDNITNLNMPAGGN
jgi:prepilin-type N-terminal cleavage/methylation domain-containing protein